MAQHGRLVQLMEVVPTELMRWPSGSFTCKGFAGMRGALLVASLRKWPVVPVSAIVVGEGMRVLATWVSSLLVTKETLLPICHRSSGLLA